MINHTFPCEDLLVLGYPARDFLAARQTGAGASARPSRRRTARSFRHFFRRLRKAAR